MQRKQRIRAGLLLAVVTLWLQGTGSVADVYEDAMRATVRVISGDASGTAFVVRLPGQGTSSQSYRLVTAGHVLEQMQDAACQVVFRRQGEGHAFVRHEVTVPIRDDGEPLWVRHPEVDVAVLPIQRPAEVDIQPFDIARVATEAFVEDGRIRVGLDVCIPGFPATLESSPAGWPVLRRGSIASHPLAPLAQVRSFLVDVSSFGGESGAPVVAAIDGRATVIGLISGMQRQTDKATMPFEERVMHTPMGLGIAIPSAFILELMDNKGSSDAEE